MIKTTSQVSWNPIDFSKKAVVFAHVKIAKRNDTNETYTLTIEEFIKNEYSAEVPNELGEMVMKDFSEDRVIRTIEKVMTFEEADQLTTYLDSEFTITEVGSYRRKKYSELGHLCINNQEEVRNVTWELAQ